MLNRPTTLLLALALTPLLLGTQCGSVSNSIPWEDAQPTWAEIVYQWRVPAGTSGKGGADVVVYVADHDFHLTREQYRAYFMRRGIGATVDYSSEFRVHDPNRNWCVVLRPWGEGALFDILVRRVEADGLLPTVESAEHAYWLLMQDDCSYRG